MATTNEVTGIRPETQEKYLEMLEFVKTDPEEYKRGIEALSDYERSEVLWWTQSVENYLAEHNHVEPSDDATARELWEGKHSCVHCCFQLSTRPKPVQSACSEWDAMFEDSESETNGQFKLWHKKVGKMPIDQRKIVWGWVKARLGMEVPVGVLADE